MCRNVRFIIAMKKQTRKPRGDTRFPGISRHAKELKCNRTHLFLVLTGQRPSASNLVGRYIRLLKKENRPIPHDLAA